MPESDTYVAQRCGACRDGAFPIVASLWLKRHGRLGQHHHQACCRRRHKRSRAGHVRLVQYPSSVPRSYRKAFRSHSSGQLDRSNGNRKERLLARKRVSTQLYYTLDRNWQVGSNVTMTQTKAHNPGTLQEPLESMWTDIFRGTASVYGP